MTGHNVTTESTKAEFQEIAEELSARLTTQYGSMLGSAALIKELGYPTRHHSSKRWREE